ncbi:MAG: hypothetical protein HRT71_04630 [Flavobacteriales bacterium]|nr:hypothetical protein [Flavobacteriales bacterium]
MNILKNYFLFFLLAITLSNCSQSDQTTELQPYPEVDESKYKWKQRVISVIYLEEEEEEEEDNKLFRHFESTEGSKSLATIITDGLKNGELPPFDPIFGIDFSLQLTLEDIRGRISGSEETAWIPSPDPPYELEPHTKAGLDLSSITSYRLKEFWYIDAEGNIGEKYVEAICPVELVLNDDGNIIGVRPLAWIVVEHLTDLLASANNQSGDKALTFRDALINKKYITGPKSFPRQAKIQSANNINNRSPLFKNKVAEYPEIDKNEVKWMQEVWSDMYATPKIFDDNGYLIVPDGDKTNRDFFFTKDFKVRPSFYDAIFKQLRDGTKKAYSYTNIKKELGNIELMKMVSGTVDTSWVPNPDPPYNLMERITTHSFNSADIIRYKVKEQWFYNDAKEVVAKRTIAFCPHLKELNNKYEVVGSKPLFWVNYKDFKKQLANTYMYDFRILYENTDLESVGKSEPKTFQDMIMNREWELEADKENVFPIEAYKENKVL